mmetsp:Transcript_95603/g.247202  ORF Transcript_95603/g.247202 Transcript_95603/m.247202 type:complete len:210 (+) Transcript_95603:998-1627(+)
MMIRSGKIHITLRPSLSGGVISSAVKYSSTTQQKPASALVSGVLHALLHRPTVADATRATPLAFRPPTRPASQSLSLITLALAQLCAVRPKIVIMMAPGYWKRMPLRRPPNTPFLVVPMANDICVELGPGMHWQTAKSSVKTAADIQPICSTKSFWKSPTCAAGPPNAVQPISTKFLAMSPKPTTTSGFSSAPSSLATTMTGVDVAMGS